MLRNLRVVKSTLAFLLLVLILFGALALLPVWAQDGGKREPAAPDGGMQALPSSTGYVIDEGDVPGFLPLAPFTGWTVFGAGGYLGDAIYTAADDTGDVAEWRPDLEAGRYQVQVHYWANDTVGTQRDDALYTVYYDGGTASQRVNQQLLADGSPSGGGADSGWLTLGYYPFAGGTAGYVELDDSTTVPGTGTNVVADAVRFLATRVWVDDGYTPTGTNDGHLWGVTAFDNIPAGMDAVADYGRVNVRPGTYYTPLQVTRPITIAGANPVNTFLSVPGPATDTAIEVLSSDVRITGFTIESYGASYANYGIRNYDTVAASWSYDLTGYYFGDNIIRRFDYGVRMRRCSGEIRDNEVYNNTNVGLWVQDHPTATPGPTTVADNTLYNNGTGGTDYDIRVWESYDGSVVSGNTVTGDGAASEVCIQVEDAVGATMVSTNTVSNCTAGVYVRDNANGVTVSGNYISGCTDGLRIWQETLAIPGPVTVDVYGNTITGNTAYGILAGRVGGANNPTRQLTVGGSVANANSIYGNGTVAGNDELRLDRFTYAVDATYNDWGVCRLREIEDEIRHDVDVPALGLVTFEPALCVPYTMTVEAHPTSMPADGTSTATVTATLVDVAGTRALPGTMIGITSTLGTVPYEYVEAEGPEVTASFHWGAPVFQTCASDGWVLRSGNPAASISWNFTGQAVSLIYTMRPTAGSADVYIDGGYVKTINMASAALNEYRVEDVIATWPSDSAHIIEVRPDGTGAVDIDAFRSGGIVASQGRITTVFTAGSALGTAHIWATAYDGRIVTAPCTVFPHVTDGVTVELRAADVYISKSPDPTSINQGESVTYAITYGNAGPETATNAVVTDTLPTGFLYVSSSSLPDFEPPAFDPPRKYVWNVGDLAAGATGAITIVAKPDPAVLWCSPVNRSNVAEINADVPDPVAGDNSTGPVPVSIVVPTVVDLTADPDSIMVSNGTNVTTLRTTVTDSNGHLVHMVPVLLTTTDGTFPASGTSSHTVTTIHGEAVASLASSTVVTTAMVTAEVLPACGGMPTDTVAVDYVAGYPDVITSTFYPTLLQLCGDEAVVTATVYDAYGNLVSDDTEVNFNVVEGERGEMYPRLTYTVNGVATSTLRTKGFLFGPRELHVYILARRETQEATDLITVDLEEGPPHLITVSSSPAVLQVGGYHAEIRALVQDCGENRVPNGTVVTFTVSGLGAVDPVTSTTTNGIAYTTFTSACTMGTALITAQADSVVGQVSLPLEAGPADLISVAAPVPGTIRNCGEEAEIEATVYDVCGNLVKDGTPVLFTPQYGYVDASPNLVLTVDGKVATTLISQDVPLATWPVALEQIDVTSGSAFPGFANLNILPGLPEQVDVSADPGSIPINGDANGYDIIVEVEVTDCSGTPVEDGTSVVLETDLGFFWESGLRTLVRPTVDGVISGTLTSQSIAGWVTLTATADSAEGTAMVRFLPDEPWLIEVWGYPTTIPANGVATSLVTALVKDAYNNPVLDGITMTFVTDYGYFAESADVIYTTFTNVDGYAFVNLVSDTVPRTALVRAIAYNSRQGYSYVFMVEPKYIYLPFITRRDAGNP